MAAKLITNISGIVEDAAIGYINANASRFKSDVPGPEGDKGDKGDQGISVHHIKGTSTTDLEGDFATFGELDTYTVYGDDAETLNLGHFVIKQGFGTEYGEAEGVMYAKTYDQNRDGVVDDSDKLGGKTLLQVEQERDAAIEAAKLALGSNYVVDTVAEKDALEGLTVGDKVLVKTDLDGKWAHYLVIEVTDGLGSTSTFIVIMDEDTYLNANSKEQIKAAYEANTNKILDNVDRITIGEAAITWNADEKTLDVDTNDGTVLQLGQELMIEVLNGSGARLYDGTVVMMVPAPGNSGKLVVVPYDGVSPAYLIVGVVTHEIAINGVGKVTSYGKVRGLNTSAWAKDTVLYVNGSALSHIKPATLDMKIAVVLSQHASNGTIMVRLNGFQQVQEW
jgi:hypothetical protein